jgi:hypothetical protein
MLAEVVTKLKTGSIKNVVVFGSSVPSSVPYVVVKPESLPQGRGVRIIVHMTMNYQIDLEEYVFNEVSLLLKNLKCVDSYGNVNYIRDVEEYTDIVVSNDDNTISMDRLFVAPSLLY